MKTRWLAVLLMMALAVASVWDNSERAREGLSARTAAIEAATE